jgi:hypothetical protein
VGRASAPASTRIAEIKDSRGQGPSLISLSTGPAKAFSILIFTESTSASGFFVKKKPPSMHFQCAHMNRKRSKAVPYYKARSMIGKLKSWD